MRSAGYIKDIFEHGFLSKTETGIPQSFSTVNELVKFVTMVIFTSSAQHSAVNTGQLDFGGWMPNFPSSLQLPPPAIKGRASEHTLLQTLPDVNTTVHALAVLWLLSTQSTDFVALGNYPQELFTEEVCCKIMENFGKELSDLDEAIDTRNKNLLLPYTYMKPKSMENSETTFKLTCPTSIGKLLLVELEKLDCPRSLWFVRKIEVHCPEGIKYTFPIYTWIEDDEVHCYREGTALKGADDHDHLAKDTRERELKSRRKLYCWDVYKEGLPHCMKADNISALPCEVRFSFAKEMQFDLTAAAGLAAINLRNLENCKRTWNSFEEIDRGFGRCKTQAAAYVQKHWKDDAFFGEQFLNGVNPMVIRNCTSLPRNFPITEDMVYLHGVKLATEMKRGNIFLCNYEKLDGVTTNVVNQKKQYLAAPLVLLHKTRENELKPIAIQLHQTPSEDNPIFVPTDSEYDWLLAKTFVRSADFNEHELNVHLLRTHLLAEVITVSLLRNVSSVHPLYKIIFPHTRYTLQINLLARQTLISQQDGVFTKYASSGGEGMFTILQRSLSSLTYSSLCIHDDIKERGMDKLPNYYYREDGLRLWDIIHKFVDGMIKCYYKCDNDVQKDDELQKWIQDICEHGHLSRRMGFPQSFVTIDDLVKFVSMIIFTCSAQHAAVSNSQFDYGAWMPNTPITLQQPPPTRKGLASEEMLLKTLPDVNVTVHGMAVLYLLSKQSSDFIPLGHYPNGYFCEDDPLDLMRSFKNDLTELHEDIVKRNEHMLSQNRLPYPYLDPNRMENKKMKTYTIKLTTSKILYFNIFDVILIKLVGYDGESDQTWVTGARRLLTRGESTFTLTSPDTIGKVLMVELVKQQLPLIPKRSTFVDTVEVICPDERVYKFCIHHWIKEGKVYRFREATALRVFDENHVLSEYSRKMELKGRQRKYQWKEYNKGFPYCMKADDVNSLPYEVQFSFTKDVHFKLTAVHGLLELNLNGLANCEDPWKNFDAIKEALKNYKSDISDYVEKNWKKDAFFGYQFLNGVNPMKIRRCDSLPPNFPVTENMVRLEGEASLKTEMEKGNIFLCDYKLLEGVETCLINKEQQYMAAPLVLLHKTPNNELKPVAIQLKQTPSKDNPIFFPTDSNYDWLLAKTFVRSADFNEHELNVHLLRTHLLAEVFTVALLRNIPNVHPLYKLLVPHTRYTLQINLMARTQLISDDGYFATYAAPSQEGVVTIMQRSLSSVTYSSLCIHDDIKERGMESVPNYYYRDDGLRLWDIIHRYVDGVMRHYYKSDKEVGQDTEIQNFIKDIFKHGFLSKKESGIVSEPNKTASRKTNNYFCFRNPRELHEVKELVKFITMIIFTCSAQHSAVNHGQFDFGRWMPNAPSSLQFPPPCKKGTGSEELLLKTLPDVNTTVQTAAVLRLLSLQSSDFVSLGKHSEEYFTEETPLKLMKKFQNDLEKLDEKIDERNKGLDLPYTYLKPVNMENSVSL
ncbi:hypothetical protein WMY93_013079 [Mugilogobius chulae]|uniref:Uncharacterized protein n=1 Tax=Mugilogobius chulae TaxID=88201 RepID=A0AAW0NZ04_9GOBI